MFPLCEGAFTKALERVGKMILALYGLTVVFSFIMLVVLYSIQKVRNVFYERVFLTVLLCNLCTFLMMCSTTESEALLAQKILYLGNCFLPSFLLTNVADLCKVKLPKWIVVLFTSFSAVTFLASLTTGYNTLYYKSVSLENYCGCTILHKEFGPLHVLNYIRLAMFFLLTLGVVIFAIAKRRDLSKRTSLFLLIILAVNIIVYFIRVKLDLAPFALCITELLLLFVFSRMNMYDMASNIIHMNNQEGAVGYVTFDKNSCYMGSNARAKDFFPELASCEVDHRISDNECRFYKDIYIKLLGLGTSGEITEYHISQGERSVKCQLKPLLHNKSKKLKGYLVQLSDDTQEQNFIELLQNYNSDLEREVERKTEHIREIQNKVIVSMADIIGTRDDSTGGHVRRTSECVRIFSERLSEHPEFNLSKQFLNNVTKAAPMHDLGKIAVDDNILRKPGRYTPEEYEEMKKHSEMGAQVVRMVLEHVEDAEFLETAVNVAHYHHEKWDGSGYPCGLSGENIPMEARIMALADVFDALVSKRCYKEAFGYDRAFAIIEESLGTHFDAKLGRVFLECREELCAFYDQQLAEEREAEMQQQSS